MTEKYLNLNCKDIEYFVIEFDDNNYDGIIKDQEMFDRWLRDLRSGKYTQLRGEMYSEDSETSYCSFGMLCKKYIRRLRQTSVSAENIIIEITNNKENYFNNITIYSDNGFKFFILDFIYELNDYCNLSFNMIADIMEAIHKEIRGEDNSKILKTLSRNDKWELLAI